MAKLPDAFSKAAANRDAKQAQEQRNLSGAQTAQIEIQAAPVPESAPPKPPRTPKKNPVPKTETTTPSATDETGPRNSRKRRQDEANEAVDVSGGSPIAEAAKKLREKRRHKDDDLISLNFKVTAAEKEALIEFCHKNRIKQVDAIRLLIAEVTKSK